MTREETIGDCRLILGDCREVLPEIRADAFIMDPPYNFSTASSGGKHQFWADAVNSAYWFGAILEACRQSMQGRGCIWQFLNWKTFIPLQKAAWEIGAKFDSLLVWDKEWIGPGGDVGLRPSYELVAFMAFGGAKIANRGLPDIWRSQWAAQRPNGHPAEKPVDLIGRIVKETPGNVVCDPFLGSGTTGVACVKQSRPFVGIEIDEHWFDIACKRIEAATKEPRLPLAEPKMKQTSLLDGAR